MKKGKFYRYMREDGVKKFVISDGYIDGGTAYYNHGKSWSAIDIDTGMAICTRNTRKECKAEVVLKAEQVRKAKVHPMIEVVIRKLKVYKAEHPDELLGTAEA